MKKQIINEANRFLCEDNNFLLEDLKMDKTTSKDIDIFIKIFSEKWFNGDKAKAVRYIVTYLYNW